MSRTKKRMMADVLWEAANRWLSTSPWFIGDSDTEFYSCCAIARAINKDTDHLPKRIEAWVSRLGCDPGSGSAFDDFERGIKRQGVRYMWLLLAMHVAEDEGITV